MRRMSAVVRTWGERIRNTPGLGKEVTAVAVCLVVGLACGGYILGGQQWQPPWKDHYVVYAELAGAPGVRPESPQEVRIAGVPVGRITDAKPTEDGTAVLELSLEEDQEIYDNARIVLRTKSPINVMYVAVDPGGPPGKPLADGGRIPIAQTSTVTQPSELLDHLDADARAALTSLVNESDVALAGSAQPLADGLDTTSDAMQSFSPVIEQLDSRRQKLARLVHAVRVIIQTVGEDDERLGGLVRSLHTTLDALASRDDDLAATLHELPGFTSSLGESMTGVSDLTDQLDPLLDDIVAAREVLPGGVKDLTDTVTHIKDLAKSARPVVAGARPVVADLRPLVADLSPAARDLVALVDRLPNATKLIAPWMEDLAAFVYQTSSSFSAFDVNGGTARANFLLDLTNPSGGLGDVGIDPEQKKEEDQ